MAFYDRKGNIIANSSTGGDSVLTRKCISNPNLVDPSKVESGLLNEDGTINEAFVGSNGGVSDFIPVVSGKRMFCGYVLEYLRNPWFEATKWGEYCYRYLFFAEDKTTVVGKGGVTFALNTKTGVAVPDGAAYVRVSWYVGQGYYLSPMEYPEKCFVHLADDFETAPMYWHQDNIEKTYIPADMVGYTYLPPYVGKKWVLFGDSLTDAYAGRGWDAVSRTTGGPGWTHDNLQSPWTGYPWGSHIARELGLTIDNRAKSGSNIYYGEGYNYADVNGCNMLDAYIAEIEAGTTECADYITIGFGSNTRTQDIGTNADTSETRTSVYGAMKYFIERLRYLQRNYNQNMVFGFVLPPQSSWGEGDTRITSGRTAMLEVLNSDEYAVPCCDMWKESGICLDQMTDGIHVTSAESNNLYYHAMRRFMMGL